MTNLRVGYLAIMAVLTATLLACGDATDVAGPSASTAAPTSTGVDITENDDGNSGAAPAASLHWPMDGDGRAIVGDDQLTFSGNFVFAAGSVSFDGVTGSSATGEPGPVDTAASFSIAAWVNLDHAVDYAAAVSQLGDVAAAFGLGYTEGAWSFFMKSADSNEPGSTVRAQSAPAVPEPTAWVHLVGVHDQDEQEIRLYVDGQPVAAEPFTAPWQASGPLTVGRSQAHAVASDFWPGAIDDVRVYGVALTDADVELLYLDQPPTSPPPTVAPVPSDPAATFKVRRDEICVDGSNDIAAINAETDGGTPAEGAAGLRRVKERIEAAQAELDELEVPESWVEFVEADDGRRQERLRLVDELANALEQEDFVLADTVDRDLTALNVETEAAEDSNGLRHCP